MSTIRVDRISPYQAGSVTIDGNVIQANAATTGSNTFVGDQIIEGTLTASIQEGHVLVGGSDNVSTLVATSSFGGGGGSTDITALNSFTTSQENLNGTFAITGSNSFVGNQNITGSLSVSGAITGSQVGNIIPFYFDNRAAFPSASTYHGAIAHSHSDGKMYYAHGGNWIELANTTGSFFGSFVGDGSGLTGISGVTPINTGSFATTGSNTFIGNQTISGSLFLSGSGNSNFVIRDVPLASTPTGFINTIIGVGAGKGITLGTGNIFLGYESGFRNTSGDYNTFIGVNAGYYTVGADQNSFVGYLAGEYNQGADNTSLGFRALRNNGSGNGNVSIGSKSGERTRLGGENGSSSTSIFIGNDARPDGSIQTNQIVIGYEAIGNGSNTTTIGNTSTTDTYLKGTLNVSTAILAQVSSSLNFVDDTAAASGGVPLGGLYRNGNVIQIRLV